MFLLSLLSLVLLFANIPPGVVKHGRQCPHLAYPRREVHQNTLPPLALSGCFVSARPIYRGHDILLNDNGESDIFLGFCAASPGTPMESSSRCRSTTLSRCTSATHGSTRSRSRRKRAATQRYASTNDRILEYKCLIYCNNYMSCYRDIQWLALNTPYRKC